MKACLGKLPKKATVYGPKKRVKSPLINKGFLLTKPHSDRDFLTMLKGNRC